jgi:5'(3')-deoxyribonucleotidase
VSAASNARRIAIDMDEVLADTLTHHLALYNAEHGAHLTKADVHGRKIYDAVDAVRRERVRSYPRALDFFRHIPVMPGAQEVVADLARRHEVFVTTAAMEYPTSFTAKYEWLREHFPFIADSHIVFCGDKSIVHADYLIDDSPHHFARFAGQGLLFAAPHNVHETRYPRMHGWDEVARYFA